MFIDWKYRDILPNDEKFRYKTRINHEKIFPPTHIVKIIVSLWDILSPRYGY